MSAIACTFVDLRTVKTRKMIQIILEAPVEQAEAVIDLLGFPRADNPVHVAIARLMEAPKGGDAADYPVFQEPRELPPDAGAHSQTGSIVRKRWHELSRAQQAGIRCSEERFRAFLMDQHPNCGDGSEEWAARLVRSVCSVDTRTRLDVEEGAGSCWDRLDAEFRQWAGLEPEQRS